MEFVCQYCGRQVGNKGSLANHENACINNPNHKKCLNRKGHKLGCIPWNKGLTKETSEIIRKSIDTYKTNLKNKKFILHPHKWTDEEKINLSIKQKIFLLNNKESHVWKRNEKFISKPCENLKKFFKDNNINFVEEYEPFNDVNYCVDIAFPDEKIAIEVNGNQHYNKDGSLKDYYQKRHDLFVERGWKIFEIHYTKCYNIDINEFTDILSLPIYDKNYVGLYFSKKEKSLKKRLEEKQEKQKEKLIKKQEKENIQKQIIYNLINNSNIDFTKQGWSTKALQYLKDRNELYDKLIIRSIRKYYPEFLKRNDVWIRKNTKI